MATDIEEPVSAGGNGATAEEVKPYRIHVSSRYLNLTKQKLEIARLPHEVDEPQSKDWWQPKSQVEPLIDFWLEQYQWRDQEQILNGLPQFRTGFTIPQSTSPIRIQFIHARSPRANAITLLLIPPFPFSSLSVGHLVRLFTEPEEANRQPFHLVIPSLPGLGFSDTLPENLPVISSTANLLDSLMKRLHYPYYLVTNAGAGALSPAHIDYKLADWLATQYPDSCLGTHLISPPLARPSAREAPLGWAKWSVANLFKASALGYRPEDHSALKKSSGNSKALPAMLDRGGIGLTEPNTLAYALCDSPTGLLVFVLKGLRMLGPRKEFAPADIIHFTQLAWLPGPEAALRFWAHCARHPEEAPSKKRNIKKEKAEKKATGKSRVALTVFLGDEKGDGAAHSYSCPAWANTRYNILHAHRATGDAGLLAWERPELIAAGVRGLAAAVLRADQRLQQSQQQQPAGQPETAQAVVAETSAASAPKAQEQQQPSSSSSPPVPEPEPAPSPKEQTKDGLGLGLLAPPPTTTTKIGGGRLAPVREVSDETKVASNDSLAATKSPSLLAPGTPTETPSPVSPITPIQAGGPLPPDAATTAPVTS